MKQAELDTKISKRNYFFKKSKYINDISIYYLQGVEVQIVDRNGKIYLSSYDSKNNQIRCFKEIELLLLIEMIVKQKRIVVTINQKADIVMCILCKKLGLFCISELKNPFMYDSVKEYLGQLKQQEISDYVYTYLRI